MPKIPPRKLIIGIFVTVIFLFTALMSVFSTSWKSFWQVVTIAYPCLLILGRYVPGVRKLTDKVGRILKVFTTSDTSEKPVPIADQQLLIIGHVLEGMVKHRSDIITNNNLLLQVEENYKTKINFPGKCYQTTCENIISTDKYEAAALGAATFHTDLDKKLIKIAVLGEPGRGKTRCLAGG